MLSLLITLVVIGVILYLVNNFIPMDEKIKKILNIVVIILVIVWVINLFVPLNLPRLR